MSNATLTAPPRNARDFESADPLSWSTVCAVTDLELFWGEAALVGGEQIAVFRLPGDRIHAVSHIDPHTHAAVIARGIVGSRGDRTTVASPLHKQVYDLETGECLTHPALRLSVFPVRIVDGIITVGVTA